MTPSSLIVLTLLLSSGPAEGGDTATPSEASAPGEEPAGEEPAGEEPAGEEPAAEDAPADEPAAVETGEVDEAEAAEVAGQERAEPDSKYSAMVEDSPFVRKGFMVMGGPGFTTCVREACTEGGWEDFPLRMNDVFREADLRLGPGAMFEFGGRPIEYVGITGGFSVSYNPVRGLPDRDLWSIWYQAGANVLLYPVAFSRFDPYVGVGLGFTQMWMHENDLFDGTYRYNRGNFRLSTGVDIFATQRFQLGPRFEWNVPFAGESCLKIDRPAVNGVSQPDYDECQDVSDHGDFKDKMPRQFGLFIQFKGTFGKDKDGKPKGKKDYSW